MSIVIEDVSPADLDATLVLNESEVPHVGRIDIEQMHWFAEHADYFRVAKRNHELLAFLIGLLPGSTYASPNYRWFCDRYPDFAYVDRIAVAPAARGLGVAKQLYADFAAAMPDTIDSLTCEVNILPPNEGSMKFHARLGFHEVGTLSNAAGDKKVALLRKELKGQ